MDAREIEKCIDEFGTDIYRFCLKLCMDKSEAEDLYQQTFLKALEMEWTLDWGQNPKALFFSLTHNLWKSDRRKQARRNMIAPCSNLDDEAEAVLHSEEGIEERYLQKELISEVNRIIETLPEKIRIPLTLFYLSNCSVEQISTIIKKPPGTVKSRLFIVPKTMPSVILFSLPVPFSQPFQCFNGDKKTAPHIHSKIDRLKAHQSGRLRTRSRRMLDM